MKVHLAKTVFLSLHGLCVQNIFMIVASLKRFCPTLKKGETSLMEMSLVSVFHRTRPTVGNTKIFHRLTNKTQKSSKSLDKKLKCKIFASLNYKLFFRKAAN